MKTLVVLLALVSEITVEPPMVKVVSDAYSATISAEKECTSSVIYYIRKGSLENAEIAKNRKYWTDDRIVHFCPDPDKYGTVEIHRGHIRALMLTPAQLEREVNYAANLIPVFRAANLKMLAADKRIREICKDASVVVKIYMRWDDSPRMLVGTDTDIPDTIHYVCIDIDKSKTVFEATIPNN